MRLLLVTQVVDSTDSRLGFFHSWIKKLAPSFESIEVICLYQGVHDLPPNVHVHSLGKEKGSVSKLQYSIRFLGLIWRLRNQYDRIFVHMNEEYVLLGGVFWNIARKKVFLWRNHYAGSLWTRIAGMLCSEVFYTSDYSYTARFRNALQMPVGVDTSLFHPVGDTRKKYSILFFGRITPSKKPDLLIDALALLHKKKTSFTASFYGPTLPNEQGYLMSLREKVKQSDLTEHIAFYDGVEHSKALELFGEHEIYVNLGESGMFDKTLFEASASGCIVLALSTDFRKALTHPILFEAAAPSLAQMIEQILQLPEEKKEQIRQEQYALVSEHSLDTLMSKLTSGILA